MSNAHRLERPNIAALITATMEIRLDDNQMFCETDKAYELWQTRETVDVLCYTHQVLDRMIKRWPKRMILWVIEKETDDEHHNND